MSTSSIHAVVKSKKGCLTCRTRRVKCDETLPACMKCQKSHRQCAGYSNRFTQVRAQDILNNRTRPPAKPLPHHPPSGIFCDAEHERQAYDMYRHATAPNLSGYLDRDLWYVAVLQCSQSEAAIYRSVTAIGFLSRHHATCITARTKPCACQNYQSAIAQYSKAVKHLRKRPGTDHRVSRIACALFTCLEALLGNLEEVLRVLDAALVLHELGTDSEESDLLEFFQRLKVYYHLFREGYQPSPKGPVQICKPPLVFTSLADARRSLYSMIQETIGFVNLPMWWQGLHDQSSEDSRIQVYGQQYDLLHRLRGWHGACNMLSAADKASEAFSILESHVLLAEAWVRTVSFRDETAFRQEILAFSSILSRASKHLSPTGTDSARPTSFNFELGWMLPLYWTAIKCRQTELRIQALQLLSRLPRQEGLWHSDKLVTLASRVIEREREGLLFQKVLGSPVYVDDGANKFRADFYLAVPAESVLAQKDSEILTIPSGCL